VTLTQLVPSFGEWWDSYDYRNRILFGACFVVAGVFLAACAFEFVVEDCVFPIWPDGAAAAAQAALVAYGLFQAAQWFVEGGMSVARRVRAALR
jgi:hypothetical protein